MECTRDEARCGVKWRLGADFAVLGKKLRKDLVKVKNALPDVSSEDAKHYMRTGKISVQGVDLVAGDLTPSLFVELPSSSGQTDYESNTDSDVVILLDCLVRPEYEEQAMARDLANKIQKARKEARLQATDDVDVYIKAHSAEGKAVIANLLQRQGEAITKVIRSSPRDQEQLPEGTIPFWESPAGAPIEVGDYQLSLVLVKL